MFKFTIVFVLICCGYSLALTKSEQKCNEYSKKVIQCAQKAEIFTTGKIKIDIREFPHTAVLGYDSDDKKAWLCAGALISEQYVLAPAHCLDVQIVGAPKYVRLGIINIDHVGDYSGLQEFTIIETTAHPEYIKPSMYNDLALLKLDRPAEITAQVRPTCLNIEHEVDTEKAIATGWGKEDTEKLKKDDMRKIVLDLVHSDMCNTSYVDFISEKRLKDGVLDAIQICGAIKNADVSSCQADLPGLLQVYHHRAFCMYTLVGIPSFWKICPFITSPNVYTRVSAYVPWIESIVSP